MNLDEAISKGLVQVNSREWQLDQIMRALIGKIVRGTATANDQAELDALSKERSQRMMPRVSGEAPR